MDHTHHSQCVLLQYVDAGQGQKSKNDPASTVTELGNKDDAREENVGDECDVHVYDDDASLTAAMAQNVSAATPQVRRLIIHCISSSSRIGTMKHNLIHTYTSSKNPQQN